jgi:hypothetical protein
MQNINSYIFRYRDAACHLWNAYFLSATDWTRLSECEPLDSYEFIDRRLFFALVCHPLDIEFEYEWGQDIIDDIVLRPRDEGANGQIEVQLRRNKDPETWRQTEVMGSQGMSFRFIRFFQWDNYTFRDLPMVRCKIEECPVHPEYVGKKALVNAFQVDFFLSDARDARET